MISIEIFPSMDQEELNALIEEEENQTKQSFTEKDLVRILKKVPRSVAIGAITKSGLYNERTLDKALDDLLEGLWDLVPIPDFILTLLREAVPSFVADLKILLVVFFGKFLEWIPTVQESITVSIEAPTAPPDIDPLSERYEEGVARGKVLAYDQAFNVASFRRRQHASDIDARSSAARDNQLRGRYYEAGWFKTYFLERKNG